MAQASTVEISAMVAKSETEPWFVQLPLPTLSNPVAFLQFSLSLP